MSWRKVKLKTLLSKPVQNGYSPVCLEEPSGKWVLGLGALSDFGLDTTQIKPAPIDDGKVDNFLLRPGDFLVSRSNTRDKVGRSALFKGEIKNCSYPDLMMRFRVNENAIYPEFLEMYLRSHEAIKWFQRSASGTSGSMVKINKHIVENLQVPLPSLPEQTAIADLLSAWDKAIEKTERLIQAKKKYYAALCHQYMGAKNIAKRGWSVVALGDIFSEITRKVGDKDLPPFSISAGIGFVSQREKWGRDISGAQHENYTHLKPGEFSYNKGNSKRYPQGCIYLLKQGEICVPNVFISFKPNKDNLVSEFYEHYFIANYHARELRKYITSSARSDGLLNVNKKDFFKIQVPFPPVAE